MEFLLGRTLGNAVLNLDLEEATRQGLEEYWYSLEELRKIEFDAGLFPRLDGHPGAAGLRVRAALRIRDLLVAH